MSNVVGITGHQNIPIGAIPYITKGIDNALLALKKPLTCASSLAAGADQLFAELALAHGAKLHAVIPCKHYSQTFKEAKVLANYKKLHSLASKAEVLNFNSPSEEAFLEAGRRIAEISDIIFAIWDGGESKGKGGTADIVKYSKSLSKRVMIIWPPGVSR